MPKLFIVVDMNEVDPLATDPHDIAEAVLDVDHQYSPHKGKFVAATWVVDQRDRAEAQSLIEEALYGHEA